MRIDFENVKNILEKELKSSSKRLELLDTYLADKEVTAKQFKDLSNKIVEKE